jgi:hypothetical protein
MISLARVLAQYPSEQSLIKAMTDVVDEPVSQYIALMLVSNKYQGIRLTNIYFGKLERAENAVVEKLLEFLGYSGGYESSPYSEITIKQVDFMKIYLRQLFLHGLNAAMDNPVGITPRKLVTSLIQSLPTRYRKLPVGPKRRGKVSTSESSP